MLLPPYHARRRRTQRRRKVGEEQQQPEDDNQEPLPGSATQRAAQGTMMVPSPGSRLPLAGIAVGSQRYNGLEDDESG